MNTGVKIEIQQITATDTLEIRHQVMWPTHPIEYVKLPNDESGRHFGLFVNDELTSIISLFIRGKDAQFRKFATLKKFQGYGYGTLLLKRILQICKEEGIQKLWCNARIDKSEFYLNFGLNPTTNTYTKGGIEFVVLEKTMTN